MLHIEIATGEFGHIAVTILNEVWGIKRSDKIG